MVTEYQKEFQNSNKKITKVSKLCTYFVFTDNWLIKVEIIWGSLPTYNVYGDIFSQIWRVLLHLSWLLEQSKKNWREYFASFLVIGAKWINDWSAPLSLLIHAAPPTNAPFVAFILFPLCIIAIIRSAFNWYKTYLKIE